MHERYKPRLCDPCRGIRPDGTRGLPRHDECEGAVVTCECWSELLMEAEEKP